MPSYSRTVALKGKSAQDLYDKISGDIDRFLSKSNLGSSEVKRDPHNKKLEASGSMFSAILTCRDDGVQLDVKLSLLASPFRGKLDEGIDKWLAKNFPESFSKS